jgi:hypothetical protein
MTNVYKRTPTSVEGDVEIYGDISQIEDLLDIKLSLGQGQRRDDYHWKNQTASFGAFLGAITTHKVSASKDGKCFTQGSIIGERRKAVAMTQMDLLVLDMDTGQRIEEVRERILQEGLLAIIYTTHSNGSTMSDVPKSVFYKKMKLEDDDEVNDKMVATYLETFKRYTPEIAKTARYERVEHTPDGIKLFFSHAPMQKYRIVFLLDEPFIFAEESANQTKAIDKWKKKYAGLANMLDAFYDQSCVDPSRLFYYPTHRKDGEYHCEIIVGEPLRLDDIEEADPRNMKESVNAFLDDAGEGSDGDAYVFENEWVASWFKKNGERFAAGDFIRDHFSSDLRNDNGINASTCCPFDDQHTNAGDPNDVGFYGANAGDWTINGEPGKIGLMKCSHAGCKEYKSPHFLDRMVSNGDIEGPADLDPFIFSLVGDDEGDEDGDESDSDSPRAEKPTAKEKTKVDDTPPWEDVAMSPEMTAIMKDVKKLTIVSDVGDILTEIANGDFNDSERSIFILAIAKATKQSAADIKKRLVSMLTAKQRKLNEDEDEANKEVAVYITDNFDLQVKTVMKAFKKIAKSDKVSLFKTTDGQLARVSFVPGTGTAKLEILDKSQLFVALTDIVKFYIEGPGGTRRQVPATNDIVTYFTGINTDRVPLPIIERVVKHPIFTSEGRFVSKSGYDAETCTFIDIPFKLPPVNGSPTDAEVDKAYGLLFDDVFVDFPFQDGEDLDGMSSKSNLLAMIMQPFVRDFLGSAATPLYVINKPVAGAGSGKLMDCVSIIQTGEAVQTSQFTGNEEENAKVITSRLMADPASIMFFDNVNVKVNSGSLASAITSGMYSARILGVSKELKVQMQGIWAMSGIAMTFSTELARRVAPIWLVPAEAKPEDRHNFKHNDILAWVEEHRPELVWAICTIIQAWVDDGMPNWRLPPIGSFERWSRILGGILDSLRHEGFMANAGDFRRDTSYESDADLEFISYLYDDQVTTLGKVWTAGEVFTGLWDDQSNGFEELTLPKVSSRSKAGAKGSFGMYVKGLVNRKFEVIDKEGKKRVIFVQRHRHDNARNVNAYCLSEVVK